jgi:hypothetical protein
VAALPGRGAGVANQSDNHEPLDSPRVRAAAGAGNALAYHPTYEFGGDVTQLPGGQEWLDAGGWLPGGAVDPELVRGHAGEVAQPQHALKEGEGS